MRMKTISAASYSRLNVFAQCKYRVKLAYLDKIPEPDRGAPPNGKEWPNDRGSRIHNEAEHYVKGNLDHVPTECKKFTHELNKLRSLYQAGKVTTEQTWYFDNNWAPIDGATYNEIALRVICDVIVFTSDTTAVIIDYKTGRKFGNEVSHAQQLQLYQLAAFLKYPKLETIDSEIYYFDQDELVSMHFTRAQGLRFFRVWDEKIKTMFACTNFKPNANKFSCRWCPYRQDRSGDCSFGVF